MATAPLLSVGIPFLDEERLLAAAIRSVLAQTMSDFELLVIDDGSTDRSLEIARGFADPRIIVRSDGRRRHLATRLNEVTRHARGRYVARMDADDVAHPRRFEEQLRLLERDPACDAVGTWAGMIDEHAEPLAIIEASEHGLTPRRVLEHGVMPHPTLLARREWFLAHPYDETLTRTEDRELWCRTAARTRFAIVPSPLYVLRVRPTEPSFVSDYVETQRQNCVLFRRYGPQMIGRTGTARAWLSAHGKSLVTRAAVALGAGDRLVRRRGRAPTAPERALIDEAVAAARG
ncbi:MAG: glycosyltransferase family 2 protein [Labilithrix sp.]|nr:glycosyltransferase family 2 protein [Labilithrix sp.]MCW5813504.1 glycosyltransferase family 2 protein [Labilithrix sp.]